jgi:hypothetical protein
MTHLLPTIDNDSEFALALRLATQLAIILVYLVPSIIAQRSQHPKQPAILLLNVALGWTIIGWVVTLIWALNGNPPRILARLLLHEHTEQRSGFRESLLRGKIDSLKKSVVTAKKGRANRQRIEKLKELIAAAERELEELQTRSK